MTQYDFGNDPDLDRELDAALAHYAAAEPRTGLENRILARLQAERNCAPAARWWGWPAAAAIASGALILTLALLWKPETHRSIAQITPAGLEKSGLDKAPVTAGGKIAPVASARARAFRNSRRRSASLAAVEAAAPRLDQFPSPRPLSEQEMILASYVTNYPRQAALLAEAHTQALQQDMADDLAKHRRAAGDSPQ